MLHTSDEVSDFRPSTEFGDSIDVPCKPGVSSLSVAVPGMKMLWVSVAARRYGGILRFSRSR
jgi:hypothetical protein